MKFTSGYMLGAITVIALGGSFLAGIIAKMAIDEKIEETLTQTRTNATNSVLNMFKTKSN